jgi:hypothetical protein
MMPARKTALIDGWPEKLNPGLIAEDAKPVSSFGRKRRLLRYIGDGRGNRRFDDHVLEGAVGDGQEPPYRRQNTESAHGAARHVQRLASL